MQPGNSPPLSKSLVLVGAGNAHLVFARMFAMRPIPGLAVTLINQGTVIPYSAMVPAYLGGEFSADQITFDLVRMSAAFNVRLISQPVEGIQTGRRQVTFADRAPVQYDLLSLGLGSVPDAPPGVIDGQSSFVMRPLSGLIRRLDELRDDLHETSRPFHLTVVGGGASGCELALAIAKRMQEVDGFQLTLLQGNEQLLPNFPDKTAQYFNAQLSRRNVTVRTNARVVGGAPTKLELQTGDTITCDQVLWATQAAAPPLLAASGLSVNEQGFLRVRKTLQSVSASDVFGTGDCVTFDDFPDLAKSGVYAVREGKVLYENIRRRLQEKPLREFQPQKRVLYLLNTADGDAVLNYGSFAWKNVGVRQLKNWIDKRWVRKFTEFPKMDDGAAEDDGSMRCGGCGSKVPAEVLSGVLKDLQVHEDPNVLVGIKEGDDAAVYRLPRISVSSSPAVELGDDELLEVQTVDYFKSFLSDPYLFGRIAALNAASDLYAMNAQPRTALAIATLPYARTPIQAAQLAELMAGANATLKQEGISLAGGHTTEGTDLALGFSMTGYARRGQLFRKSGLKPGDALILTKPLGTGALLAALMQSACKAAWYEELLAGMLQSNKAAAEIFADAGVVACTDVTGFGLAGHLLEMLDASEMSAQLDPECPTYTGFTEVTRDKQIYSTLHEDNARAAERVQYHLKRIFPDWLYDPQTSGGLLAGVPANHASEIVHRLMEAGYERAEQIGTVVASADDSVGIEGNEGIDDDVRIVVDFYTKTDRIEIDALLQEFAHLDANALPPEQLMLDLQRREVHDLIIQDVIRRKYALDTHGYLDVFIKAVEM